MNMDDTDKFEEYFNKANNEELDESFDALAKFCHVYYLALIRQGFNEAQAMELTASYQKTMLFLIQ